MDAEQLQAGAEVADDSKPSRTNTVITSDIVAGLMAVAPERVSEIVAQFHESVDNIISISDLDYHRGTTEMSAIQQAVNRFVGKVENNFTREETTEAMINAAKDDSIVEIEAIAQKMSKAATFYLQGLGSAASPRLAADSKAWNTIIMDAASEIDKLGKLHEGIISNMPKILQERLDQDLANVLESINKEFNNDPSINNATRVAAQVRASLATINKHMEELGNATMKANVENIVQSKMTELQEKQIALSSAEAGMTAPQAKAWKPLSEEAKNLILALGKSNYLVYDKTIRKQKIAVIDQKLSLLETIRVNAVEVGQSLSGYYGSSGSRRVNGRGSIGGVGTSLGVVMSNPQESSNFINGIPPGFAGYVGTIGRGNILKQLPDGVAKAHVDAVEYFTSRGMSLEKATQRAIAEGYTPHSYGKSFSFGGGRRPLV